jgi:hypothetical protein
LVTCGLIDGGAHGSNAFRIQRRGASVLAQGAAKTQVVRSVPRQWRDVGEAQGTGQAAEHATARHALDKVAEDGVAR